MGKEGKNGRGDEKRKKEKREKRKAKWVAVSQFSLAVALYLTTPKLKGPWPRSNSLAQFL